MCRGLRFGLVSLNRSVKQPHATSQAIRVLRVLSSLSIKGLSGGRAVAIQDNLLRVCMGHDRGPWLRDAGLQGRVKALESMSHSHEVMPGPTLNPCIGMRAAHDS